MENEADYDLKNNMIKIKFHKGTKYEIPALVIAQHRAQYYSEIDGYDIDSQEYLNEINYALNDNYEIFDWIQNNMSWHELQDYVIRVKEKVINEEDEWANGNVQIDLL